MTEIFLDYEPQPKQAILHAATARQIFFGGAAGGSKSHTIRWDAYIFCLRNPGLQAYLFRKTQPELDDNHVKFGRTDIPPELGSVLGKPARLQFTNGSTLFYCYAEYEKDIYRYLGAEMHWLGIDEASRMTPMQIAFLKTRNRLGGFRPDPDYAAALPRFVMGSNPGGPSHGYLKRTFVKPACGAAPMTVFNDPEMSSNTNPEGWTSLFIPAKVDDNVYMDEDYDASFGGLPPELAQAYREGDWDTVVGQALHTLRSDPSKQPCHMIRQFDVPKHWTRFMSMDWGTASPYSIGWYAVSDGALLKGKGVYQDTYIPPGAIVRYREKYGWSGKENKGTGEDARTVARDILKAENDVIDYRIADSEIWAKRGAPSIAENMARATDGKLTFKPSQKDRKQGYAEFLCRLAGSANYIEDQEEGEWPMFFVTDNCKHFWRTVPTLVLDDIDPEKGPETKHQEDHVYDDVVYALRSRPYVLTEKQRYDIEYGPEIRAARRQTKWGDRTGYATA